jgi:periodic tryptophan protein 1
VGTLDPEIEIWSLDVLDSIYPDAILGRRPDKHTAVHVPTPSGHSGSKKKKTKSRKPKRTVHKSGVRHVDAVLSLSWNRTERHLLASASADCTVKLWDLSRCSVPNNSDTNQEEEEEEEEEGDATITNCGGRGFGAVRSFDSIHTDKIQAIQWNPHEPSALLTGSYDRTVRVIDTRTSDKGVGALLGSDVEALRWDPWEPHSFYVSPVPYTTSGDLGKF